MDDSRLLDDIKQAIGKYPDFPKPGIVFRDVFSVLRNPTLSKNLTDLLTKEVQKTNSKVDAVVGLDARGFLFGPIIAQALKCSFVPIRKKGKLPGETEKVSYTLEYGTDVFEVQKDAIKDNDNVVIVDDLLATGGTMSAACQLMQKLKANIVQCLVVIELVDLKGRDKVTAKCTSLIQY